MSVLFSGVGLASNPEPGTQHRAWHRADPWMDRAVRWHRENKGLLPDYLGTPR